MKFEIKNRWTQNVILTGEGETLALAFSNLTGADLTRANLTDANLTGANLTDGLMDLIRVPKIDAAILGRINDGGTLEMRNWHSCNTTHCRGGWAVILAGPAGMMLEKVYGVNAAAALIYSASRLGKRVPNFFATNDSAMEDIVACAKEQEQQ